MNTFITSDLHFYHTNILKYCPRPYKDVDDMTDQFIQMFNEKVGPKDHVYHLGDFMFGKPKLERFLAVFDQIPGQWHFILGNHDQHTIKKWRRDLLSHPRIEEIVDYKTLKSDGKFYVLFHYEMRVWDKKHHGAYHLFGHSHSPANRVYHGNSMDVGIDGTDYKLLTLQEITRMIDLQAAQNLEPWSSPRDER